MNLCTEPAIFRLVWLGRLRAETSTNATTTCAVLGSNCRDHEMEPKRSRTGAPDGAPDPAPPAEAPWSGGTWVYNPGQGDIYRYRWSSCQMPQWFYNEGSGMGSVNMAGWILRKGEWEDGAAVTWHVQRNLVSMGDGRCMPTDLCWVRVGWSCENVEKPDWILTLQDMERIAEPETCLYYQWMIHEPSGGPPHAYKMLYLLHSIYSIIHILSQV